MFSKIQVETRRKLFSKCFLLKFSTRSIKFLPTRFFTIFRPRYLEIQKLSIHEKKSDKQTNMRPFLKPNKAPAKIEYAVPGNAGIITLVKRSIKIPIGANEPSSSTILLNGSTPYRFK